MNTNVIVVERWFDESDKIHLPVYLNWYGIFKEKYRLINYEWLLWYTIYGL